MMSENEIFLTGGTGIAGSFALDELIRCGYPLRVMIRDASHEKRNKQFHYVHGDLSCIENLKKISFSKTEHIAFVKKWIGSNDERVL